MQSTARPCRYIRPQAGLNQVTGSSKERADWDRLALIPWSRRTMAHVRRAGYTGRATAGCSLGCSGTHRACGHSGTSHGTALAVVCAVRAAKGHGRQDLSHSQLADTWTVSTDVRKELGERIAAGLLLGVGIDLQRRADSGMAEDRLRVARGNADSRSASPAILKQTADRSGIEKHGSASRT